jgi:23S rRNA-/tRNA-specific pseudouridylate synthase
MNTIKPYKPKPGERTRCRICNDPVYGYQDYHVSKPRKGATIFMHAKCLEKEQNGGGCK